MESSCDYFSEIGSRFQKFRQEEFLCDTILVADDKELKAHSVLLAAASAVFKSTFEASGGGDPGIHYIHLPGYDSKVVEIALNTIYTGNLVIPEKFQDGETQSELLTSLRNLGLELSDMNDDRTLEIKLETKCEQFCIKQENGVDVSMPLETVLKSNLESISQDLIPMENPKMNSEDESEDEQIWNSGILNMENPELISELSDDDVNGRKRHVHRRTHPGETPFVCNTCGRSFSKRANLNRHALAHSGEKPNLCHVCGKAFIQKTQLDDHLHQHGDNGASTCRICSEVFSDRVLLRQHIVRSHPKGPTKSLISETDTKANVCDTCGKSYSTIGGLRMHERIHTGHVVTCTICNKTFVNRALLLQHLRSHTKEKMYECTSCGKAFAYKNALMVHIRVHTGEKPYKCSTCGHTYSQFGHLQSHKKTHTGDKPFVCNICSRAYKQKVDLRLHMNRVHQGGTVTETDDVRTN